MTIEELEQLVKDAGLHLVSKWAPRFLVSLRVEKEYGCRYQSGRILYNSMRAFRDADKNETTKCIAELREALYRASQTQQGDVSHEGTVRIGNATKNSESAAGIGYPAH